jgi:hypothetical protein
MQIGGPRQKALTHRLATDQGDAVGLVGKVWFLYRRRILVFEPDRCRWKRLKKELHGAQLAGIAREEGSDRSHSLELVPSGADVASSIKPGSLSRIRVS